MQEVLREDLWMQAMCVIIWQFSHMLRIRSRYWWKRQQERPLDRRDRGDLRRRGRRCWWTSWILVLVVHLPREGVTQVVNVDVGCG